MEKIKTSKASSNNVKQNKFLTNKTKSYIFCYIFILFAIIHFIIFYVAVNFNSILLAFRTSVLQEDGSIGYQFSFVQFERLFQELGNSSSDLYVGLINTLLYFSQSVFIMIPVSLIISYFLYKKIRLYKTFRVILFLPNIISGVVFVSMYTLMIRPYGLIYTALETLFGYEMPYLLGNESTATPTIMFYVFWTGLAGNMILYQGAMNRLPQEVIEAGQIDGISWVREIWSVVLPMIWPTFSITVILGFTTMFSAGGPILLFTEQGLAFGANKTMTISFFIFMQTWSGASYEYPAAIGLFFTVCSLPIVFGIRFLMSKIDPEVEY